MAKVMISIPDPQLKRLDSYVEANGETRSGFLQRLAEAELARDAAAKRQEIEDLLGPPENLGGDAAQVLRAARDSR